MGYPELFISEETQPDPVRTLSTTRFFGNAEKLNY